MYISYIKLFNDVHWTRFTVYMDFVEIMFLIRKHILHLWQKVGLFKCRLCVTGDLIQSSRLSNVHTPLSLGKLRLLSLCTYIRETCPERNYSEYSICGFIIFEILTQDKYLGQECKLFNLTGCIHYRVCYAEPIEASG